MLLRDLGSQWRTPEFGKTIIASTCRGVLRVQAWPKARGAPKLLAQANRQTVFSLYQTLIKWINPREQNYEREAIRQYNRRNRGQRGSAAIRFRDWQTQRLYGRGVGIIVSPTLTFYPPAIARDASFILDHCTMDEGQLLQRANDSWAEITTPTAGQVLTAAAPGSQNTWTTLA